MVSELGLLFGVAWLMSGAFAVAGKVDWRLLLHFSVQVN